MFTVDIIKFTVSFLGHVTSGSQNRQKKLKNNKK